VGRKTLTQSIDQLVSMLYFKIYNEHVNILLLKNIPSVCVVCQGGVVRSQHPPIPIGVDMNDPSAVARFRGHPYPPGPRQFDVYHRLVGPRLEAQHVYSVCPDSQPSNYQVCFSINELLVRCLC